MNTLDQNIRLIDDNNSNLNIEKRINLINIINEQIDKELKNLNNKFDNLEDKGKIFVKYKKKSIEELESLFDKSSLEDQIKIYQTMSQKIDDNINELFSNDSDNEMVTDESDNDSNSDLSEDL
tara:strand:- start:17 stop:385 length:369 start_codon:yes stop_codon:yes gene_type:complete